MDVILHSCLYSNEGRAHIPVLHSWLYVFVVSCPGLFPLNSFPLRHVSVLETQHSQNNWGWLPEDSCFESGKEAGEVIQLCTPVKFTPVHTV